MKHRLRALERELRVAEGFFALAILGWGLSSDTLALFGCLGVLAFIALDLWQRYSLAGLSYRRRLERPRASFGERVGLEVEISNDKPLPLSYVEIADEVPEGLAIDGGEVTKSFGRKATLVQVLPLLPYQRVRRRLVIHCDRRGEHRIGPARLTSGDPIGYRRRVEDLHESEHLLVYPKLLALQPAGIASRLLLGETRRQVELVTDPSRVAGVRAYEPGDPLRHIDWRATARAGDLLVRRFEPTLSQRVAVFLDVRVPQFTSWTPAPDELEFAVALTASLIAALAQAQVPVGLFTTGSAGGHPPAHTPSRTPQGLVGMLESLARLVPHGPLFISEILESVCATMARQTSVVVVAGDFPLSTLSAMAHVRRRHSLSALHLASGMGSPPPRDQVDALLQTRYVDDWHDRTALELSA